MPTGRTGPLVIRRPPARVLVFARGHRSGTARRAYRQIPPSTFRPALGNPSQISAVPCPRDRGDASRGPGHRSGRSRRGSSSPDTAPRRACIPKPQTRGNKRPAKPSIAWRTQNDTEQAAQYSLPSSTPSHGWAHGFGDRLTDVGRSASRCVISPRMAQRAQCRRYGRLAGHWGRVQAGCRTGVRYAFTQATGLLSPSRWSTSSFKICDSPGRIGVSGGFRSRARLPFPGSR